MYPLLSFPKLKISTMYYVVTKLRMLHCLQKWVESFLVSLFLTAIHSSQSWFLKEWKLLSLRHFMVAISFVPFLCLQVSMKSSKRHLAVALAICFHSWKCDYYQLSGFFRMFYTSSDCLTKRLYICWKSCFWKMFDVENSWRCRAMNCRLAKKLFWLIAST